MRRMRGRALGLCLTCTLVAAVSLGTPLAAQTKPEGELKFALYVTISPQWFDPGETTGFITPFWFLYAMHDALVKNMPGKTSAPCLAESWTVSADQKVYDFKLRAGLTFHNGDAFTADDVRFSFYRAKGYKILKDKVRDVEVAGPHRVRFHLHEPWPDFMTFYGTLVSGAGWIVPKRYVEQVGDDGFKKHPVGLGPYKFVSHTPGVELVLEAFEGYWRKVPSVKRLVLKSVPESTTRVAMLKRGEVDIAYLLEVPQAEEVKRDPKLTVAFTGGVASFYVDFFDMWDPKSPWADQRVRLAASHAIDRKALNAAETLSASRLNGGFVPKNLEFGMTMEPHAYDPAKARKLLADAGYPNGFDGGDFHSAPPYYSAGEAVAGYMQAVGIRTRQKNMERAAFLTAWSAKTLRGVCMCAVGTHGNAATRMEQFVPSEGQYAYGGWPDVDALWKQQARETDKKKREALLQRIQQIAFDRVRFAGIWDYVWPSGVGPRVAEPAFLLIDPYPWSAPYEELRLKK
jgi:peptide/nickel transport system substrate-binding protein